MSHPRALTSTEIEISALVEFVNDDVLDQKYALQMIGIDPIGLLLGADPWQVLGNPAEYMGLRVTLSGERQGIRVQGSLEQEAHRAWGLVRELDETSPGWRANPRAWRVKPGVRDEYAE
jgi:hypothetical protein